jgi:hypothetical protein
MASEAPPVTSRIASQFEQLLAEAFRRVGWDVVREPAGRNREIDLLVRHGALHYVVELKSASEGRRDRLIPLLAQAILQAQAAAHRLGPDAVPMAVVASPRISDVAVKEIRRFAEAYAPNVAVGVLDLEGLRAFVGRGLEALNAPRPRANAAVVSSRESSSHLFSDLHQWMLKVLLAPHIPADLLSAPRGEVRNASQLAQAANVSAMSASRFVRQLKAEGFLDEAASLIRIVRVGDLLSRWRAVLLRSSQEWPMRWIIRGDPARQLEKLLKSGAPESPRMCLGYFAAAEQLGYGFVHGIKPHVYIEHKRADVLQHLGLARAQPGEAVDVYLRLPLAPQAVFRAAVWRLGLPVCDILQVWFDVGNHQSRGAAQAAEIEHRVMQPLLAAQ